MDDINEDVAELADSAMYLVNNVDKDTLFNKRGDFIGITKIDYLERILKIIELDVLHNPTIEDSHRRMGKVLLKLAKCYSGQERIGLYEEAIESLETAVKIHPRGERNWRALGEAVLEFADDLEYPDSLQEIRKSIRYFKRGFKLYNSRNPENDEWDEDEQEADYYSLFGRAYNGLAQHLTDYSEKLDAFATSLSNLLKAVEKRGDEWDYWYLAETQEDLAEDVPNPDERKKMQKKAIKSFRKSYSIDEDPVALERIKDLEE